MRVVGASSSPGEYLVHVTNAVLAVTLLLETPITCPGFSE